MQAHPSDGGSQIVLPIVKLTRAHRDAIRDFIELDLESDSLSHYVKYDKDAARAFVARLSLCLRLLDQLGWRDDDPRDEFELLLDGDTFRLLSGYAADAQELIEYEREQLQKPPHPLDGPRRYEDVAGYIDTNLDAIHAAKLAEAALKRHESMEAI